MSIRDQVKQLLRMCGHAFVGTIHERLDVMERQANSLSLQTASLAETQGALLQASIHVVETLQQFQDDFRHKHEELKQQLERLETISSESVRIAELQRARQNYSRSIHDE